MKELLRDHLTPEDDGRAFTEAVLFRAAGALHRRRAGAAARASGVTATEAAVFGWLERWARPWVIAALVVLAVAAMVPVYPRTAAAAAERVTHALSADAAAALLPEEVVAITVAY